MAVKKIDNYEDGETSEERLDNLKANAERNKELREQAKANRGQPVMAPERNLEESLERSRKKREYREMFDKKKLKENKEQSEVRKEIWESEQKRKYDEFMAEEYPDKKSEKPSKTETARRTKEYAEAKKESIEATRELSRTKKKAFCEDHPYLCRIRYGKKTRDSILEKEDDEEIDMRMFQGMPSEDFREPKRESGAMVNIYQGGYPAPIQTSERESPRRDYPRYDENPVEPKKGTKEKKREKKEKKKKEKIPKESFCEKHPKICSAGKKTAVATGVALSVASGDLLALSPKSSKGGKKPTAKKTTTTAKPKPAQKKTATRSAPRKADDGMPAAFSSTPAKRRTPSKTRSNAVKGKAGSKGKTTKAKSSTGTAKKSSPKKESPPKNGWWGDGDAGLFD